MSKLIQSFRLFAIGAIAILSTFLFNANYALAADNYSAATDTYQESRNPNRVNTTTEELAKSNLNEMEETEGESIYEHLVEKVDNRENEALVTADNKTSKK